MTIEYLIYTFVIMLYFLVLSISLERIHIRTRIKNRIVCTIANVIVDIIEYSVMSYIALFIGLIMICITVSM